MQHSATAPTERRRINVSYLYFFGALGGILFGYDLGVISGVLLFINPLWHLDSFAQGVVGGSVAFGAIFGALYAGRITDRWGRRPAIVIASVVFVIGVAGCTFAPGFGVLVVGRFITGIAVGCSSATVPTYLSELAPTRARGRLSTLNQLMIVSGILIAYIIDWALSGAGSANWRIMFAIAAIPAVVLFVGLMFMPETPRWLVKAGREAEAREVLAQTHRNDDIDAELGSIREVIRLDSEQRGSLRDLISPWAKPALIVALILAVGQQFAGTNAVNLYAPTMFKQLGLATSGSLLASIIMGAVKLVFTAWVFLVVDRWGRKPLLLIGNVLMALALILLGACVLGLEKGTGTGIIALLLLCLYWVGYELGWGAVVWVMMAEIFPLRVRGIGMGVSSTVLWAATFAITFLFPVMSDHLGLAGSSFIFAGVSVVLFVLVRKFVPETKGRSLEEIEMDLRGRVGGTAQEAA
ncbi:sugar porter family MFS transporter [Nocardia macrotermitis]|uniref:Putative metabolite transport protein CsbC n=1 Tax=Nocardia macrotermitis TaxID=2585198 RepID=A0A7K0D036_9NOCA|nr:sugar porter family MFS transporter [Nocardia macrotermitis]MQY19089.1 putative metabolite transport protein CsbC [Nocardia macrotermitis]